MSKFTQGKWIYDGCAFIEDEHNTRLAMVYSCNVPEWRANARLLAAAKDMYELLLDCADQFECMSFHELSDKCYSLLKRIDGPEEQS